ncbi:hypothetical protein SUGI_0438290 [Cryptomeria japonica]|nr:hypothetical protein SUGI_0438290 [Cryptomeria japonica]
MLTYDLLCNDPGICSSTHPLEQIDENSWTNGAHQMSIMDEAQFDFEISPLTPGENSWYSSSSEEQSNTEGFPQMHRQYSVNSSSPSVQTLFPHSAFSAYVKASPMAAAEISPGGQILHKRCFRFLSAIQKKEDSAPQISTVTASASNNRHQKSKTESSFGHMIAERNRRIRLKQHFTNLYSLLPGKTKRDKDSILVNTTSYLRELKLQVAKLEQQNKSLLKFIQKPISNKSEGSNKIPQLSLVKNPTLNGMQDEEQNEEESIVEWETILDDQVLMDGWLEEIL